MGNGGVFVQYSIIQWGTLMLRIGRLIGCGRLSLSIGCSRAEKPFTKSTIKVKGMVTVNGEAPKTPVQLDCMPEHPVDLEHPSASTAVTGDNGSFEISTYTPGDGVPDGEYALTATWIETNVMLSSSDTPDKLRGKYDSIKESPKKFIARIGDEPIDLGTIELTTKKK